MTAFEHLLRPLHGIARRSPGRRSLKKSTPLMLERLEPRALMTAILTNAALTDLAASQSDTTPATSADNTSFTTNGATTSPVGAAAAPESSTDHAPTLPSASDTTVKPTGESALQLSSGSNLAGGGGVATMDADSGTSFSVGSFASNGSMDVYGQSFKPNVAGPDGVGSPGTATSVSLQSIVVGYASSITSVRATDCYVYSAALTDENEIGTETNLVAMSSSYTDGSAFGTGSYTRQFNFSEGLLDPTQTYYFYFDCSQYLRVKSSSPYSGGSLTDDTFTVLSSYDIQFQVTMTIA